MVSLTDDCHKKITFKSSVKKSSTNLKAEQLLVMRYEENCLLNILNQFCELKFYDFKIKRNLVCGYQLLAELRGQLVKPYPSMESLHLIGSYGIWSNLHK